jgi:hypothetical protein
MSTAEIASSLTKDIRQEISSAAQRKPQGLGSSVNPVNWGIPPDVSGNSWALDHVNLVSGDHLHVRDELIGSYFEKHPDIDPEERKKISDNVTKSLPMDNFKDLQELLGSRRKAAAAKVGSYLKAHPTLANAAALGLGSSALLMTLGLAYRIFDAPSTQIIVVAPSTQ